jgi:hypothetical protein
MLKITVIADVQTATQIDDLNLAIQEAVRKYEGYNPSVQISVESEED